MSPCVPDGRTDPGNRTTSPHELHTPGLRRVRRGWRTIEPIDELEATVTPRGPGPRVVLGEAEPDGWLRFVLEGEGADIVGHATSDEELGRVLGGVVPDVIVLDMGISATAALDARERADTAAIVVVWPSGVASVVAEERVDPDRVVEDLGEAVRSAAARTTTPTIDDEERVPEPVVPTSSSDAEPAGAPTEKRRTPRLPVAVASWVVYLTFVAAIASAVPKAFEPPPIPDGMRETRPTANPTDRPATDPVIADVPVSQGSGAIGSAAPNEPAQGTATGGDGSISGNAGVRPDGPRSPNQGNPSADGEPSQGEPGEPGQGGGRPEDPGSQGQGGGRPEDPGHQGQGNQGGKADGKGNDKGNGKGHGKDTRSEEDAEADPGTRRSGSGGRPHGTGVTRSVAP